VNDHDAFVRRRFPTLTQIQQIFALDVGGRDEVREKFLAVSIVSFLRGYKTTLVSGVSPELIFYRQIKSKRRNERLENGLPRKLPKLKTAAFS